MRENVETGPIIIKMDKQTISVRNGGMPIPVIMHPVWKEMIPQVIFGTMMSSSNYNKNKARTECGVNGFEPN